jgi:hypothetical protein
MVGSLRMLSICHLTYDNLVSMASRTLYSPSSGDDISLRTCTVKHYMLALKTLDKTIRLLQKSADDKLFPLLVTQACWGGILDEK